MWKIAYALLFLSLAGACGTRKTKKQDSQASAAAQMAPGEAAAKPQPAAATANNGVPTDVSGIPLIQGQVTDSTRVTFEARKRLLVFYKKVVQFHKDKSALPASSAGAVPGADHCCSQKDKLCQPNAAIWEEEPWKSIGFSANDQVVHSFGYERLDDASFRIYAESDEDCDGKKSISQITGKLGPEGFSEMPIIETSNLGE